jgi:hypothetical protein
MSGFNKGRLIELFQVVRKQYDCNKWPMISVTDYNILKKVLKNNRSFTGNVNRTVWDKTV